jgi:hypothetical protein
MGWLRNFLLCVSTFAHLTFFSQLAL